MNLIITEEIIPRIKATRDAGQKEYAQDEDNVFANFERISNILEISREKVLMVYLLKHIDGISAYTKGHKSQREDVRGRLTDAIVYLMLLWSMVVENE
jgi:protoporphyrinogen oxidase